MTSKDTIELSVSSCPSKLRFFLIHETGHIIALRNPGVFLSFPLFQLLSSDVSCYDIEGYARTYSRNPNEGGNRSESFAESIALFLYYQDTVTSDFPLTDFPSRCPQTYEWVRENIFQGIRTLI